MKLEDGIIINGVYHWLCNKCHKLEDTHYNDGECRNCKMANDPDFRKMVENAPDLGDSDFENKRTIEESIFEGPDWEPPSRYWEEKDEKHEDL